MTINAQDVTISGQFCQDVPLNLLHEGKTYTYAIKETNGTIRLVNTQYGKPAGGGAATKIYMSWIGTENIGYRVYIYDGDIEWAALYEGTYTVNTLPPFVSTNPRIENLKLGNPVQPPNLLVNSNFRNPINSRGITSPNGPGYYIDKWKTGNSPAAYSIVNGVGITMTANDGEGIYWDQALPYADVQKYIGKYVTLAFSTDRGLLVRSVIVPSNGYDRDYVGNGVGLTVGNMDGAFWADIFITSGETITLYWAALYEGSYTADTLPPYVPTHPRAENLKLGNPV